MSPRTAFTFGAALVIWLIIVIFIVPAVQTTNSLRGGGGAGWLAWTSYGLGLVTFVILPIVLTRPIRKLRRSAEIDNRDGEVFCAWKWTSEKSWRADVVVVSANNLSIRIDWAGGASEQIPWNRIAHAGLSSHLGIATAQFRMSNNAPTLEISPLDRPALGPVGKQVAHLLLNKMMQIGFPYGELAQS